MPESSQHSHTPKQKASGSMKESTSNGGRRDTGRNASGLNQRFVDVLGWVITAMWASSMILQATNSNYEPPVSIHVLMTAVAGAAFGTNFIRPKNGGSDNDDRR